MEISFFSPGWKLAERCNDLALNVSWDYTPGSSCTLSRKLSPSPAKLTYGVEVLVPSVSNLEVGLLMVCPYQWILLMMEHLRCGEIWGWSLAGDTGEWDSENLPWGPGKPLLHRLCPCVPGRISKAPSKASCLNPQDGEGRGSITPVIYTPRAEAASENCCRACPDISHVPEPEACHCPAAVMS